MSNNRRCTIKIDNIFIIRNNILMMLKILYYPRLVRSVKRNKILKILCIKKLSLSNKIYRNTK